MEARPQRLPSQKELSCALAHDGGYPLIRWHSSSLFLPHPRLLPQTETVFFLQMKEKIPPRQSLHTPIAGKPMGTCHRLSCYPVSPNAACPRRLCQPPWTQPSLSETCPLSGGTAYEETHPPNASRSSGERGLGGEGLLSEKPPLPPESPPRYLSGREREGGGLSEERPSPSHTLFSPHFATSCAAFCLSGWKPLTMVTMAPMTREM